MANFICEFKGVRGRTLRVYDTKCIIKTDVTFGSLFTNNATDGEKTIFLKDVVGVQYKNSGITVGYLQLETASSQMNNKDSNFYSENTFTFEEDKNGITSVLMRKVYDYLVDRIEELKYGVEIIEEVPDFNNEIKKNLSLESKESFEPGKPIDYDLSEWKCNKCGEVNDKFIFRCDCGEPKPK